MFCALPTRVDLFTGGAARLTVYYRPGALRRLEGSAAIPDASSSPTRNDSMV
jgi:hypothetical protein